MKFFNFLTVPHNGNTLPLIQAAFDSMTDLHIKVYHDRAIFSFKGNSDMETFKKKIEGLGFHMG